MGRLLAIVPELPGWTESQRGSQIHAFQVPLNTADGIQSELRALLSDDERARADRFRDPLHGRRFTACRAALRLLLGEYLHAPPQGIVFRYGAKGKPALAEGEPAFNVSHSADLAAIVIASCGDIGVDVERYRDDLEDRKLARRFFSDGELSDLATLSDAAWQDGFYACWTRKEAYMKAVGDGFSIPLRSFRVSLLPNLAPALLEVPADPDELDRWELREMNVPAGFRAAIVARRPIVNLAHFQCSWRSESESAG